MSETPTTLDDTTPPLDVKENVVEPEDTTVEVAKNQEPVADLDEEA